MDLTEGHQQALDAARLFIAAFNNRDLAALTGVIADDAEFRKPGGGEVLRGADGARVLLTAAEDVNLRLVPPLDRREHVEQRDGAVVLTMPVRELIGPDEVERLVEFEIRDGRITAFVVRPLDA